MKLWTAWLQGYDNAPTQVKQVFKLWEALNPDCTLNILEQSDVTLILNKLNINYKKMTPQVATDIARTYLLTHIGGAWVDSSLLPTKPITDWLTPNLLTAGFFAFRSSGDPNLCLQNWFLAAEKGNVLTSKWLDIFSDYFRTPRYSPSVKRAFYHMKPFSYLQYRHHISKNNTMWFADPKKGRNCLFYPYAIHNYNLAYLIKNDEDVSHIWESVPFMSAAAPLFLGNYTRDEETSRNTFENILEEILPLSPIHKLQRNKNSAIATDIVFNSMGLTL